MRPAQGLGKSKQVIDAVAAEVAAVERLAAALGIENLEVEAVFLEYAGLLAEFGDRALPAAADRAPGLARRRLAAAARSGTRTPRSSLRTMLPVAPSCPSFMRQSGHPILRSRTVIERRPLEHVAPSM